MPNICFMSLALSVVESHIRYLHRQFIEYINSNTMIIEHLSVEHLRCPRFKQERGMEGNVSVLQPKAAKRYIMEGVVDA